MEKKLKELVDLFEHNKRQYKGKHYDEAKTRADFIDKFFELLGWDIYNKKGYAEQYREVVREDRVEIKGKVKAPDYSFRIGGLRKFFVEAKKPSVDIKHDIGPAFQLRRYAYTAKLPLSILTDFEEFAVYDTRIKPDKNDKASTARIFYCTYDEYEKEAEFIFNTFSRDAILKGSFDKYIEGSKRKKGTSEVDKEFLKLIEKWREDLAKNIALRNRDLTIHELNYAVQKIIDRIIFLRIAEDRHTEKYGRIQKLLKSEAAIYTGLVSMFAQADAKYNSGIFDFKADQITKDLKIDDKVFKGIIKALYYPDSPYEFSVFDVEILGNIYEQFLGKTIRLTAGHQAKIEDKPEVKKAGGVYYTPKYIVDYIVKNTVGEKIKNKTPEQITELKIVDPACGSGSFLLGAYQVLMDYHLNYYTKEKNLKKSLKENKIYQLRDNEYRLTIEEKHKILLNNIFGVDIDSQAVEVSKLSLLLKLLEGESQESAGQLFKFSDIKLLPDLSFNIKCGNSLIGSDFYESGQMNLFEDEEAARRINVFDWDKEFPEIFKQGGFDVVIGNPPYVRIDIFKKSEEVIIKSKYSTAKGKYDLYYLFLERLEKIINADSLVGYILPNRFTSAVSAKNLRSILLEKYSIFINSLSSIKVFKNASNYPIILILNKSKHKVFKIKTSNSISEISNISNVDKYKVSEIQKLPDNIFPLNSNKKIILIYIKSIIQNRLFSDILEISEGFRIPEEKESNAGEHHILKQYQFSRYSAIKSGTFLLEENRKELISYTSKRFENSQKNKIVIAEDGLRIEATFEDNNSLCQGGVYFGVLNNEFTEMDLKFILGILNSKLIDTFYKNLFSGMHMGGGYLRYRSQFLGNLPLVTPNENNRMTDKLNEKLIGLVKKMLDIHNEYYSTKLETEKNMLKKQIDILDNQIDQLVYKLYGLTEDEIKIVENNLN